MAGKHSNESSDDDVKDRRDRYRPRPHSSKKVFESDNHRSRRDESDSSDSDRGNRSSRREKDEHRERKESHRSLVEDDEQVIRERGRQKSERLDWREDGNRREEASSAEDDKQVERERGKRKRERSDRREGGHRRQEASSAEDEEKVGRERGRRKREKSDRREDGHRQQEASSAEDEEQVEKEMDRRKRERSDRNGDRHKGREAVEGHRAKESDQCSDEDGTQVDRKRGSRERERIQRHGKGHKRRDNDGHRSKYRNSLRNSEDEHSREGNRKPERQRDGGNAAKERMYRNGHDYRVVKDRREEENDYRDDHQNHREKEGHGRMNEELKPLRQSAMQEGNSNTDASNLGRSGGVYVPPFKLARMMKEVEDKSSAEYQRLTWDALRKSINGLVNKVNAANIKNIIPELFAENLIRGRGLFCRSCMKSQMASPGFTDVFAAMVAVVNTKFPEVGDLLLRRIVLQLKRAYKRNDKPQLLAAVKFIAHLVNQQVAHEIIALELLTLLLENPTDDSVEVAVGFVTECGSILQDLSPKGLHGIFERFRGILHEGEIDKRVQFLIEGLFAVRKAKFQGYPAVRPELDLVEQEDQLTHELSLTEEIDSEIALDIFKLDPQFLENEKRYEELKKAIVGEESEDEEGSDAGSDEEDDDDDDDDDGDDEEEELMKIKDETETNLINLRRTIYLTIMSSVDFEEAGHKLLKIKLEPGQEMELCIMLLECCSQERTYLRYYGLLGQRFCMINRIHQENFETCFKQQYSMIHRLETNKLRNVAKFFAHLLGTDALPWHVLAYIRLTEEDTTSSSRIFIKILFQELSEHLGIRLLNERLLDPTMQGSFESIFPKDNPKNTRFAINFFTSIGLGGITENLRDYLKNMPRLIMQQQKPMSELDDESGSSGSSDSEEGTSSESDTSSG